MGQRGSWPGTRVGSVRVLNAAAGWVVAGHVWARMRAGPAEVGQQLGDRFEGPGLPRSACATSGTPCPPIACSSWSLAISESSTAATVQATTNRAGTLQTFRRRIAPPAPHEAVGQRTPEASGDHRHHHEAGRSLRQPSPSDLLPESPPVQTNPSDDRHAARGIALCAGHEPAPHVASTCPSEGRQTLRPST